MSEFTENTNKSNPYDDKDIIECILSDGTCRQGFSNTFFWEEIPGRKAYIVAMHRPVR